MFDGQALSVYQPGSQPNLHPMAQTHGGSFGPFGTIRKSLRPANNVSQHITAHPQTEYRTSLIQAEVNDNLMKNRMFYEMTHSEYTKQNLKEDVNLERLWAALPGHHSSFFSNKTVLKNRDHLM